MSDGMVEWWSVDCVVKICSGMVWGPSLWNKYGYCDHGFDREFDDESTDYGAVNLVTATFV